MPVLTEIVEGWTGALPFTLNADDVAVNLTGLTVQIILKDSFGTTILDSSSGVTVTGSTAGQVEYAPTSTDFLASGTPYKIRFRVIDALAKRVYFPNADEDLIKVNVV